MNSSSFAVTSPASFEQPTPGKVESQPLVLKSADVRFSRRYLVCALLLLLLSVGASVPSWIAIDRDQSTPTPLVGVDPNVAPWWELAALPQIGETTAKAIVAYREEAKSKGFLSANERVFGEAADLDRVKGIGPKTVHRITRYLRFD